ncbi:uteroglobin [Odocoileus virginianus]|uniref:Uteroglobin n=1 Tax=Odocoileus virginianus TaxID=9874 RepID=A0A6J0ZG71_ODOVR|nr:uteroglobin [Odocoileus virginianus texanus]
MKLTIAIAIALVTLTLFCRPASTEVCPSLLYALGNLIIGTPASYEAALEPFNPDEDMKEATRQLKTLIDTLSPKAKDSVLNLMGKIVQSPECA